MDSTPTTQPPGAARWLAAARPRTLTLALASIALGNQLAAAAGRFDSLIFLLTLATATGLQILSNLANDYGDFRHGADSPDRTGPRRAVAAGLITPAAMKRAVILTAGISALAGLTLVWMAFGRQAIWLLALFLFLGLAALWAAIAYTASDRPYGYRGLGDPFVLLFFGWVGVAGSYVLQTRQTDWLVLLPATGCGLLAVGVLNVNNIRDRASDARAGKRTLPVRLGPRWARVYHWALLGGAVLAALGYVVLEWTSPWQLLFLLATPLLWRHGRAVARGQTAAQLDPRLRELSLTTLAFSLLLGLGMMLGAAG